jgi:hypothetical protein
LVGLPDFRARFEKLLRASKLPIDRMTCWHPNVYDPHEFTIPLFLKSCWTSTVEQVGDLNQWWVKHGGKTPTWDLLCLADIDGSPGVVLVEAKAHVGELSSPKGKSQSDPRKSAENWEQIRGCIRTALAALQCAEPNAINFGGRHYQTLNRLTWAHKLAVEGLPVVLVYLGFTDDPCWPKDQIAKGKWRDEVFGHARGILPQDYDLDVHKYGNGRLWFRAVEVPTADVCPSHWRVPRR